MDIKPIIKSETRVKSMFAFMNEDDSAEERAQEGQAEIIEVYADDDLVQQRNSAINDVKLEDEAEDEIETNEQGSLEAINENEASVSLNSENADEVNASSQRVQNSAPVVLNVSDDKKGAKILSSSRNNAEGNTENMSQDDEETQSANSDGVKILKRSRGDLTVDATKTKKKEKMRSEEATVRTSKIVEVGSKTYDGAPQVAEKMTFKMWWASLGRRIANGWDNFMQKKGAGRFLILLGIMIVVMVGAIIYALTLRTNIEDLFVKEVNAFVMTENGEMGSGTMQDFSLGSLMQEKASAKNTAGFRTLTLTGKDLNKFKHIETFSFYMYTQYSDVTLKVSLKIYNGDDVVYELASPQVYEMTEKRAKNVSIRLNQSIEFEGATRFELTFDEFKTSDLDNSIETLYNKEFSLFRFAYN